MSKAICNIVYIKKDYLTSGDTVIVLENKVYYIGIFRENFTDTFYPQKSKKFQKPLFKVEPMIATKNKDLLIEIFGHEFIYNEKIIEILTNTKNCLFKQRRNNNNIHLFKIPNELYVLKKLPPNTEIQLWKKI